MTQDNMKLWYSVNKTAPSDTKKVSFGRAFTAISPQSQRRAATEQFGPYGLGWGIEVGSEDWKVWKDGDTELVDYTAVLFYKINGELGRFPINSCIARVATSGKGKHLLDEDWNKKVSTDALTKGLSMLGFNSDVFEGKFDDNKYIQNEAQSAEQEKADAEHKYKQKIKTARNAELKKRGEEIFKPMKDTGWSVKDWDALKGFVILDLPPNDKGNFDLVLDRMNVFSMRWFTIRNEVILDHEEALKELNGALKDCESNYYDAFQILEDAAGINA